MSPDTSSSPSVSPTLAAIVVTMNRPQHLRETLSRLRAEKADFIVVVDNGSDAETRSWLAQQADETTHIFLSEHNLGGAGGFAMGMQAAIETFSPDWLVVMDDDARPFPGAFDQFRQGLDAQWDAVAAAVTYPDGTICEMNRPLLNPFRSIRAFLQSIRGFRLSDTAYAPDAPPKQVQMTSFVGFFVSAKAIARIGYPDPRLFLYGDDQLYALRLSRAGLRIGFMPAIRFEHDCATFETGLRIYKPVWKAYYNYRNGILVYRGAAGLLAPVLLALRLPRWFAAARHYGDEAPTYRRLLRRAILDGLLNRLDRLPEGVPGPGQD
ncbi:glycosyltransferase [Pelagimonas sp. KU-00592-HH]|uniref:glycosyltransferase n=1 Tax=Pelagimonas sp. KU-00592-HH TaxID=3127651 RepID=UPI003342CCF6